MQEKLYSTPRSRSPLLAPAARATAIGPRAAFAQSGSAGGSIGNDEKSLSGSRSAEPERPARRSKPAAEEPRTVRAATKRWRGRRRWRQFRRRLGRQLGRHPLRQRHPGGRRDQRQDYRRWSQRSRQPQRRRQLRRPLRRYHRHQFRSFFRPRRLRNVQAIGRLCRNVDGVETIRPLSVFGLRPVLPQWLTIRARIKPYPLRNCGPLRPKSLRRFGA